jgi:hypothetical protein
MAHLRVLITNIWLNRGGTESVVRDISLGLLARGHVPIVYSPTLGEIAQEISARGIAVVDDLACLREAPDIIHAHHYVTAGEALLAFPKTPAVYVCHGWDSWLERPPRFPQLTYIGVSEATRDRMIHREGISPSRTMILPNAVNLRRIPPRQASLSKLLQSGCVFSNDDSHFSVLQEAGARFGLTLSKIIGRSNAIPEHELVKYDLVFATGRSAIEALCAGCAVVVCDRNGLGGLVTTSSYEGLRAANFALRALTKPVTVNSVALELSQYDAADALSISERIRQDSDLDTYLDKLLAVYLSTIAEHKANPPCRDSIHRAERFFLHEALPLKPSDPRWPWLLDQTRVVDLELFEPLRAELHQRALEVEQMKLELTNRVLEMEQLALALHQTKLELTKERDELATALNAVYRSRSWRLTKRLRAMRSNWQKLLD